MACGHLDPPPPGWRQAGHRPVCPSVHRALLQLPQETHTRPIATSPREGRAPSSPPSSQGSCGDAVSPSLHTRSRPEGTLLGRKGRRRPGPMGRAGPPRTPGGWSPTRLRCGDPHARPASGRGILLKGFHSTQAFSSKASDCLMQGQPGRGSTSRPGGAEARGSDMQQPSRRLPSDPAQDKLGDGPCLAGTEPPLRGPGTGDGSHRPPLFREKERKGPARPHARRARLEHPVSRGPGVKGRKLGPVTLTDHGWAAVHHSPCPAAPAPAPVLLSARPSLHVSS